MPSFFDKLKKGMNIENSFEELEEEQSPAVKKQKPVAEKKQAGAKRTRKKEASFAVQEKKTKKTEIPPEEEPVAEFLADEERGEEKESPKPEVVLPTNKEEPETADDDKEEVPSEDLPAAVNINLSEIKKNMEPKKKANKITNIMANTTANKEADTEESEENTEETAEKTDVKEEAWPDSEGELVVDVYQTEGELVVQSAVAGIKPEELDIDIEKDILIIKGARKNSDAEKRDYFFQECYWGAFSRQIILPVEVDASRVKAEMREGVLTIRMPKIIKEGKKKISVQAS